MGSGNFAASRPPLWTGSVDPIHCPRRRLNFYDMSIPVTCRCGQLLAAEDHLLGQQVTCPSCGSWLLVSPPTAAKPTPGPSDTTGVIILSAAAGGAMVLLAVVVVVGVAMLRPATIDVPVATASAAPRSRPVPTSSPVPESPSASSSATMADTSPALEEQPAPRAEPVESAAAQSPVSSPAPGAAGRGASRSTGGRGRGGPQGAPRGGPRGGPRGPRRGPFGLGAPEPRKIPLPGPVVVFEVLGYEGRIPIQAAAHQAAQNISWAQFANYNPISHEVVVRVRGNSVSTDAVRDNLLKAGFELGGVSYLPQGRR